MGIRLRHNEWQRQIWKFFTHPVMGVVALVAVVLVAVGTILHSEVRLIHSPQTPVIFSPK